jgi:hypothetical protein
MARNYDTHPIVGVTADSNPSRTKIREWLQHNFNNGVSLDAWADTVTRHKIVNVAFGEGADPSEFELSGSTKMVVTRGSGKEVTPVSNRFNLVDNKKVAETMVDVLENFNLGDATYGEGRNYKDKIVFDLYFDTDAALFQSDTVQDVFAFGVSIKAANDRSSSVVIEPIVRNGKNQTTIRGISDGERRFRHVKGEDEETRDQYDEMYEMFAAGVFSLGYLADSFMRDVEYAANFTVDFSQEDFGVQEFYQEWLGESMPDKIIDMAVPRSQIKAGLITENGSPLEEPTLTMYELVSGFTYAIAHGSNVSDGATKDRYHKKARNAISDSLHTLNSVRRNFEPEEEEKDQPVVDQAATLQQELEQMRGS